MAFRPAGMSDDELDEEDEFLPVSTNNIRNFSNDESSGESDDVDNKKIVKNIDTFHQDKQDSKRQDEQEEQFKVLNACLSGNLNTIKIYLEAGHNVDDYLYTGWTLLLYGASSVLPEVIEFLTKLGANPNKSKDGLTPLMVLCDSTKGTDEQCLKCVSILLEAKANVNACNKNKKSVLMFACASRSASVVEVILKHTKDIDQVDSDGRTALHHAAASNKLENVKALVKKNAATTFVDRSGLSAADIAGTKDYKDIENILSLEKSLENNDSCKIKYFKNWRDMFSNNLIDEVDHDVAEILYSMGLEAYRSCFKSVELKTFLNLTEEDLQKLGVDIAIHRIHFLDYLHKFHTKPWSVHTIGSLQKDCRLPRSFTLFNGVELLGNVTRQIKVIGSSFLFVKNGLNAARSNGSFTSIQEAKYCSELLKTENTLLLLKRDLYQNLRFAKRVEKANRHIVPADYIAGKERKRNWTITISLIIVTGMYLSKTSFVQRLWNN